MRIAEQQAHDQIIKEALREGLQPFCKALKKKYPTTKTIFLTASLPETIEPPYTIYIIAPVAPQKAKCKKFFNKFVDFVSEAKPTSPRIINKTIIDLDGICRLDLRTDFVIYTSNEKLEALLERRRNKAKNI